MPGHIKHMGKSTGALVTKAYFPLSLGAALWGCDVWSYGSHLKIVKTNRKTKVSALRKEEKGDGRNMGPW